MIYVTGKVANYSKFGKKNNILHALSCLQKNKEWFDVVVVVY